MSARLFRLMARLSLEERILNFGALMGIIGVFLPWIGGGWIGGEDIAYSGFGFFTSILGWGAFLLYVAVLLITVIPLTGGPSLVRREAQASVRFCLSSIAVVLTMSALSVLTRVIFEFSRMEIRFGIYVSLIGGLVSMLYSWLLVASQKKKDVQQLFYHSASSSEEMPPPSKPEEHRI